MKKKRKKKVEKREKKDPPLGIRKLNNANWNKNLKCAKND